MQCCIISPISPASRHPENPASHPLYYYLLYIPYSLFSVLPPPVPLHSKKLLGSSQTTTDLKVGGSSPSPCHHVVSLDKKLYPTLSLSCLSVKM